MNVKKTKNHSLEILESRIAPASILNAVWTEAAPGTNTGTGTSSFELNAGEGLKSGSQYYLFVEKGNAIVFGTDLDSDNVIDYDEITGIAAGDGLRLISFVDIHGSIITNLKETPVTTVGTGGGTVTEIVLTLTDSDNNPANDFEAAGRYKGDGRVLLNNTIEKIEMRSLTEDDLPDENGNGSKLDELAEHVVPTTYSIYGDIYAGRGFGADDGGLIVDSSGGYTTTSGTVFPSIGSIKVGTAASGQYYTFGSSNQDDWQGVLTTFTPAVGHAGASINGLKAIGETTLNINGLIAGHGGVGAAGGDIKNITLSSDDAGGYYIIAGNGGNGLNGGKGGSILNFSDTGSATGKVIIKTGDGGTGTTGTGGDAGDSAFGTLNLRGDTVIELGDGGDGFKKGGAGASLSSGVITNPGNTDSTGLDSRGVTNYSDGRIILDPFGVPVGPLYTPKIGSHLGIDFNNDGFGDYVTTTINPSQVMVSLGDGSGGFLTVANEYGTYSDYAYFLSGVRNPDAMVVADLNADGHPDIAVASSDLGNTGGILVYLSKYEDLNEDGLLTGNEDLNKNGVIDFVGFYDGRFSPMGHIAEVNQLAAGDFNGDGVVELVMQGYYIYDGTFVGGGNSYAHDFDQVLGFLQPDVERDVYGVNHYTGQFYLDYGTKGSTSPSVPAAPERPIIAVDGTMESEHFNVQVTALTLTGSSTYDVVLVGHQTRTDSSGGIDIYRYDDSRRDAGLTPAFVGIFELGDVDTDRAPGPDHISAQEFPLHDFTIQDLNGDGRADVTAISSSELPGYMIGILGNGLGTLIRGDQDSGDGSDQAGNYKFWGDPHDLRGITSGNYDAGGADDDFAIAFNSKNIGYYNYASGPDAITIVDLSPIDRTIPNILDPDSPSIPMSNLIINVANSNTTTVGVGTIELSGNIYGDIFFPFIFSEISFPYDSLIMSAGDGGDSLTGEGGRGGFFGTKLKQVNTTVVVDDGDDDDTNNPTATLKELVGDLRFDLNFTLNLDAGQGGAGFSRGGDGGGIAGVTTESTTYVVLTAGEGGRGVAGAGGDGGSLISNSIDSGREFYAGNGGVGRTGGEGGSVVGINRFGFFDTYTSGSVDVIAGFGGYGTRGGGAGGSITNFHPDSGGYLSYIAGDGGNAVSGPGGKGGSVINSSPSDANGIGSDIYILAGNGGGGTTGGLGGSIKQFTHNPSSATKFAEIISILAGNGGVGSSGAGGHGGDIVGIDIPTDATNGSDLTSFAFNRVIAGNGGSSSANKGGNGGMVSDIYVTAGDGSTAVVAGAGGHGLTAGGKGGNASNIRLEGGASTYAQGLVIAGAGGSAAAFVANPLDLTAMQGRNAFGGTVGVGGAGGSINGVYQPGGSGQGHINLIAGDGGGTLHYGTIYDTKAYVGTGGSVQNVNITMDLGNITGDSSLTPTDGNPVTVDDYEAVPIKSYNNLLGGETLAQWVVAKMRPAVEPFADVDLDDSDGNVGIVVGAAGRNKPALEGAVFQDTPSNVAKNGDLINIRAGNLLAAVAGNVDRIAAINSVRGLNIAPGFVGVEKGQIGGQMGGVPDPNYLDENGVETPTGEPEIGGRLFDGAVFAYGYFDLNGKPVTISGLVFEP